MQFLHDKGVVHGDLKPKNILVTPSGRVVSSSLDQNMESFQFKLADFGLVRTKMKSRSLVSRQARTLEMVRWRAPELLDLSCLIREEEHDKCSTDSDWDSDSSDGVIGVHVQNFTFMDMVRADVYNFGLTCSQILNGGDPCSGLGVSDLLKEKPFLGVRPELPPTCPAQLSDLIKSCWGEKTERPSFQGILSELEDLQASFTRTGSPMNTITGRIDSELQDVASENSVISRESSERPGGSSNLVQRLEIDQKVGVPIGHFIKDIQGDKQQRKRLSKGSMSNDLRKARALAGNLPSPNTIKLHKEQCKRLRAKLRETLDRVEKEQGSCRACSKVFRELRHVAQRVKTFVDYCCYKDDKDFVLAAIRVLADKQRFVKYCVELDRCMFLLKDANGESMADGFERDRNFDKLVADSKSIVEKDLKHFKELLRQYVRKPGDHQKIYATPLAALQRRSSPVVARSSCQ